MFNNQILQDLEKIATKIGFAKIIINGEEFEVSKIVKSKYRRYSYRHGDRHLARDQIEKLFKD